MGHYLSRSPVNIPRLDCALESLPKKPSYYIKLPFSEMWLKDVEIALRRFADIRGNRLIMQRILGADSCKPAWTLRQQTLANIVNVL